MPKLGRKSISETANLAALSGPIDPVELAQKLLESVAGGGAAEEEDEA